MRDSDYERETKKVFDSNRTLYLNSVKLGKKILLDPVHMLYDYDPDGTIGAGTRLNVRQANRVLKPFNMKVVSTSGSRRILVVQKDYSKPVPTNWCEVADTVLVGQDGDVKEAFEAAWKGARYGRKSWRNLVDMGETK